MNPVFKNVDTLLSAVERVGNVAGYFVGFATGPVRFGAGKVEILAGIALVLIGAAALRFSGESWCGDLRTRGLGYIGHGMANVFRGALETVNLFGGVIPLFVYDLSGCRFHYQTEPIGSDETTLNVVLKALERKNVTA